MLRLVLIFLCTLMISLLGCQSPSEPVSTSIGDRERVSLVMGVCDESPLEEGCNNSPPWGAPPGEPLLCSSLVTSSGQNGPSPTPATDSTFPLSLEGTFDVSGCTGPALYRIIDSPIHTSELEIYWFVSECRERGFYPCTNVRFHSIGGGLGADSMLLSATDGLSGGVFTRHLYAVAVHQPSGRSSVSSTFMSRDIGNINFSGPPICNRGTSYMAPGPIRRLTTSGGSQVIESYSRNICTGAKENRSTSSFP